MSVQSRPVLILSVEDELKAAWKIAHKGSATRREIGLVLSKYKAGSFFSPTDLLELMCSTTSRRVMWHLARAYRALYQDTETQTTETPTPE